MTPWKAECQASLSITSSQTLLKLKSIESMMTSNPLILCAPILLLPSIFPNIRVFSNESVLHIKWPKYWSFSFSISSSNEYSGLISFRIYWFDLLAVQGTLKSLLQHHNLEPSKAPDLLATFKMAHRVRQSPLGWSPFLITERQLNSDLIKGREFHYIHKSLMHSREEDWIGCIC